MEDDVKKINGGRPQKKKKEDDLKNKNLTKKWKMNQKIWKATKKNGRQHQKKKNNILRSNINVVTD
jgi:hypothetical protein